MRILFYLLLLTLSTSLTAQVGVNNPNPQQALDVDGKIKLTDDATVPTDGTVRYNNPEGTFEGYTGGQWEVFNKSATPTNVEMRLYRTWNVPPNPSGSLPQRWVIGDNVNKPPSSSGDVFNGQGIRLVNNFSNIEVPSGKLLMVDQIIISGLGNPGDFFSVRVARTDGFGQTTPAQISPVHYMAGTVENGPVTLKANHAPLLVLRPGEAPLIISDSSGTSNVAVTVIGFLVDDSDEFYGQ